MEELRVYTPFQAIEKGINEQTVRTFSVSSCLLFVTLLCMKMLSLLLCIYVQPQQSGEAKDEALGLTQLVDDDLVRL